MKWKALQEGDTRIVRRFLLLPREVNGWVYWLCWVRITQVRRLYGYDDYIWEDLRLIEDGK